MNDEKVAAVLATFPALFGFRGFPGSVFRCSATDSYVNDRGCVTVYTERLVDGAWLAFAKGSPDEVRREMIGVAMTPTQATGKTP